MNVKLSSSLWMLRQKLKFSFQKAILEGYAKHIALFNFTAFDNSRNFDKILNIMKKISILLYDFSSFLADFN